MFDSLTTALGSNQLLSGGVALALLGVAAMWLRDVPARFAAWAKHFFVTTLTVDSRDVRLKEVWEPWPESSRGLLFRPWVHWFRLTVGVVDLATGQPSRSAVSLLRTSPMRVWEDVTRSRYELASQLWGALTGLGVFLPLI